MTFDDYWQALVDRNPGLADDGNKMKITVESFKRSLRQAFDKGHEYRTAGEKLKDKFGGMFGGFS